MRQGGGKKAGKRNDITEAAERGERKRERERETETVRRLLKEWGLRRKSPTKFKVAKSSSQVGFGGNSRNRSKSRSRSLFLGGVDWRGSPSLGKPGPMLDSPDEIGNRPSRPISYTQPPPPQIDFVSVFLKVRRPGWGGQNVPKARGRGLAPKVGPWRLGLLTPKLVNFYRISVARGQFQGPLEIQNFHPPL